MARKEFVVFGMGRFGMSVAKTLSENGCQVLAVDEEQSKIELIADDVTYAVCTDVTDVDAVNSLGISNFDGAVIAIGGNLEASVMVTILAKELGIPYILAKAQNELHAKILKKVGADMVVFPEKETGIRIAHNLIDGNLFDAVELSEQHSMMDFQVPESWIGKSLRQLNLRNTKKINVIGLKRDGKLDIAFDVDMPLIAEDVLIIIGKNNALSRLTGNRSMITSSSNAQIKNIEALLKKGKERREQKAFVIEGRKMFEEVLLRKDLLLKAYFSEEYVSEHYPDGVPADVPHEIVADSVFRQMSETVTPQGVLAIVRMPEVSLEQILTLMENTTEKSGSTLLLLEDLRDPGNLGTIIRTAEAAGVAGILLTKESVDVYNPKVIRSTMGAVFRVPCLYVEDFFKLLDTLANQGVRLLAAHLKGTKSFAEADYSGKTGILIGNEANGLSERASELATEKVLIPMAGEVESLNAAVAAALLMYEAFRKQN